MKEFNLMAHVFFGVTCVLATLWVFVDVLNAREANLCRIRALCVLAAAAMWLAMILGGYWYVADYKADKALILQGPWPFAHNFFMETKEHFVITLLLLATYLPIVARNNLATHSGARRLALCVAGLILVVGLASEGHGAIIAMGVKTSLLAHAH